MQVKILFLIILFIGCGKVDVSKTDNSMGDNRNNEITQIQYLFEPGEGLPDDPSGLDPDDDGLNNPICNGNNSVNGTGFLFKPVSASNGNLVVLFPTVFESEFLSVKIMRLDGTVEEGEFSGFNNGQRQHWRFSMPGEFYLGTITAESLNGECTWIVPDTSKRTE